MSFDEIKKQISDSFFVNFFLIVIAMGIYLRFMGYDIMAVNNIFTVAVMSGLTGTSELVLYSKKELRRSELLVRHIICVLLGAVIVLSIAFYSGWISWNEPTLVIIFIGMVIVIHIISVATDFFQTKKKTDEITKKIGERNKKLH